MIRGGRLEARAAVSIAAAFFIACAAPPGARNDERPPATQQASSPARSDIKADTDGGGAKTPAAPSLCETLQRSADDEPALPALLDEHLSAELRALYDDPEEHRLQLLVGEVVESGDGETCLIQHGYRVDAEYVYPASSIKTAAAIAALQLLGEGGFEPELQLDDVLWVHEPHDLAELADPDGPTTPQRRGSLREIIEATLIVSSNPGYNALFDVVGHERLNRSMWDAGLDSARLQHRFFSPRTKEQETWSPRISVGDDTADESSLVEVLPPRRSELDLPPIEIDGEALRGQRVGTSHIARRRVHDKPMDFSPMNYLSLEDHQRLMVGLYKPALTNVSFSGLEPHQSFLTATMGRDPRAFADHLGDGAERRFKPALSGVLEIVPRERIRYDNKGGRAYGFHVENAYIVDRGTGRSVFLTAVVYVNENQRLNDDVYEYDELSFPFFHELGAIVARAFLSPSDEARDPDHADTRR